MTPKNWKDFQHYKDRKPAWIKLHRGLLDDFKYARLPLASRALAPLLWLLASEYNEGKITAGLDEIAFRVHTSTLDLVDALKPLVNAGLFIDDSDLLAGRKHNAIPEREEETQVQTEEEGELSSLRSERVVENPRETSEVRDDDWPNDFRERFWAAYPRKVGKGTTFGKLTAIRKSRVVTFERLMVGVLKIPIGEPRFIPHPKTWLGRAGWDDEFIENEKTNGLQTNGKRSAIMEALDQHAERFSAAERDNDFSEIAPGLLPHG